jgi:hypothetical protein
MFSLATLQLHNVQKVVVGPEEERNNYHFRRILIYTKTGETAIELFSHFPDENDDDTGIPVSV